ncbi:hypothetical protein FRB96_003981 [Tulasnella sp. 330]|nr:hypothetical protein FRB96_003981 [Tulasnella sp. 330]KAG8882619.1 hypothetical protein FRB97_008046 [Tulasnella sp. 331]KAG8888877.1 hypothetical protein FRB98_006542 [Tulasnella sp. 332]
MLSSALLLALTVAVPTLSAPLSSPFKLVARGVLYPEGYRDIGLWSVTVNRINDFSTNKKVTKADKDLVLEDVNAFMAVLDTVATKDHRSFGKGSITRKGDVEHDHLILSRDLAAKQKKIWLDMESAKWNAVFKGIDELFSSALPSDVKDQLKSFLLLTGGDFRLIPITNPTMVNCRSLVQNWESNVPQPELFIKLDAIYSTIQRVLSDYAPFINTGPILY